MLYRGGFYRGGPVLMSAITGIDQALWDIKGKALGVPVYELLGGAVREKIRVYAWIGGDRPGDVAREALAKKEAGYTAIKMNGTEEVEWIGSPARMREAVERAAAIREACGPDFGIAIDFHGRVHKGMAKVLMQGARARASRSSSRSRCCRRTTKHCSICAATARSRSRPASGSSRAGVSSSSCERRRGHHPARLLARRRHHRVEEDRHDGRGLRRRGRPALPARPDLPRGSLQVDFCTPNAFIQEQ